MKERWIKLGTIVPVEISVFLYPKSKDAYVMKMRGQQTPSHYQGRGVIETVELKGHTVDISSFSYPDVGSNCLYVGGNGDNPKQWEVKAIKSFRTLKLTRWYPFAEELFKLCNRPEELHTNTKTL